MELFLYNRAPSLSLEVDLDSGSHGGLHVDLSNVLPLLLKKRGEKIHSELGVDDDIFLLHAHVSDSDVEAHDLLHLELDGGLDLIDLGLHIISRGKEGGEFTCLGKTGSQKTRDLLDHVIGGEEEIVLLGELLHHFLVLVELLKILNTHVVNTDTVGHFTMGGISKDTALHVRAGNGRKFEGSRETLVTDGVVVLQGDLAFDGFNELSLLSVHVLAIEGDGFASSVGEDVSDSLVEECGVKFGRHDL